MELIGTGRDCDGFDVGGGRVLRRSRCGRDLTTEAATMQWARRHGVPVPEVFGAEGSDLVMERLHGPDLLDRNTTDEEAERLRRIAGT